MSKIIVTYPPGYIEQCFNVWYSAGRPKFNMRFMASLPELGGKRPTNITLRNWSEQYEWERHADTLDQMARELVDMGLVERKSKMLLRVADEARKLQQKALDFLLKEGFDSSAAAVKAFSVGVELEKTSLGLSEQLAKLGKMTEDELRRMVREFAERDGAENILDTMEAEEQNTKE